MIKINLIPTKLRKTKEVNFELQLLVGTLLFSFLLIGAVYVKNTKDINRLRDQTTLVGQQTAALQPALREFTSIERDRKEVSKRIGVINKIKEGRAVVPRILYDLSSVMKENVWLKRVVKDEGRFELEGRSLDNESICEFVERLSKLPYFTNIELKSVEDVNEADMTVKKFIVVGGVTS
jgi:type IV pilus assembly protein PilN